MPLRGNGRTIRSCRAAIVDAAILTPAAAQTDTVARGRHLVEGIGGWTDAHNLRAMTEGASADGRRLLPPTGYGYDRRMTPQDLADLVVSLRRQPAQP